MTDHQSLGEKKNFKNNNLPGRCVQLDKLFVIDN